jgi:hypothetical protein
MISPNFSNKIVTWKGRGARKKKNEKKNENADDDLIVAGYAFGSRYQQERSSYLVCRRSSVH